MARLFSTILLAAAALITDVSAQCPNEVAIYNFRDRTMSVNNTWFLVPVPREDVQAALDESFSRLIDPLGLRKLRLLDVPSELNFPAGMHPVVAVAGSNNDVRQGEAQLATGLMTASTMIPYVAIGASSTPLIAPLVSYLAGLDEKSRGFVAGLLPSVVATGGGLLTRIGAFIPLNEPYQTNGDGSKTINSKWAKLPNPITGPGLYSEAVDAKFVSQPDQASPRYSLSAWKRILNQPYILGSIGSLISPKCQRNTNFFTNSTAQPTFRSGNVTLGPSAGANPLTAVLQEGSPDGSGFYQGVFGFSACAQLVGYGAVVPLGEDCEAAARAVQNTPGAL